MKVFYVVVNVAFYREFKIHMTYHLSQYFFLNSGPKGESGESVTGRIWL